MSGRRCPSCGGLVSTDARWCGQCLSRLDAPTPGETRPVPEPAAEARDPSTMRTSSPSERVASIGGGIRADGEAIVWTCPTCGSDNSLDARTCGVCGTAFGRLFQDQPAGPEVPAGRAVALSLVFPGLGHAVSGHVGQGLARAVSFGYAVAVAVATLIGREGAALGPFLPLLGASLVAAVGLYVLSAVDAARAARSEPQVLSTRMISYGATTLVLLTVAVLVIAGLRAT